MPQMTVDEARDALIEAQDHFHAIEEEIKKSHPGLSTPEKVLSNIEHEAAYREAAQEMVEAKATYEQVKTATTRRLRSEAEAELNEVEVELVGVLNRAEEAMDTLAGVLGEVVQLSKARYGYTKAARGRAGVSLLSRNQIAGWLRHRLSHLEIADLGRAEPHYRDRLSNLLGLPSTPSTPNQETT